MGFSEDGFVIKKARIPVDKINKYIDWHLANHQSFFDASLLEHAHGYSDQVWKQADEILEILLCDEICQDILELIDSPPAIHASFISWNQDGVSWHYDMAPELRNGEKLTFRCVGAWVALEDIKIDSGLFSYIPGSHNLDVQSEPEIKEFINSESDGINYDTKLFEFLKTYIDKKVESKELVPLVFDAKKGDVLYWDGRLFHMAHPQIFEVERRAIIGHYTNVTDGREEYGGGFKAGYLSFSNKR